MKIIGKNFQGNLTAVEFSNIGIENYDEHNRTRIHLYLKSYNYTFYYNIFKKEKSDEKCSNLTIEEAETIINKVATNEYVDLRELGPYVIIDHERWETVFIRNDINEFDDEDIPILISVSKD